MAYNSTVSILREFLKFSYMPLWAIRLMLISIILRHIGFVFLFKEYNQKESCLLGIFPFLDTIPKCLISKISLNWISIPFIILIMNFISKLFHDDEIINNFYIINYNINPAYAFFLFIIAMYIVLEILFLKKIKKTWVWVLPMIALYSLCIFKNLPFEITKTILDIGVCSFLAYSIAIFIWGALPKNWFYILLSYFTTEENIDNKDKDRDIDKNINPYLASYYAKNKKDELEKKYYKIDNNIAYNAIKNFSDKKLRNKENSGDDFYKGEVKKRKENENENENDESLNFDKFKK